MLTGLASRLVAPLTQVFCNTKPKMFLYKPKESIYTAQFYILSL